MHRMNRLHDIEAMLLRWIEIEDLSEAIQQSLRWSLYDPDSAVTLNVTMTSHRAGACARFSEFPRNSRRLTTS